MSELVTWKMQDLTPGQRGVKVIRKGQQELVHEMHTCDEWELIDGRYRCGLTFGDSHRCDVTLEQLGRAWSTWTYERHEEKR